MIARTSEQPSDTIDVVVIGGGPAGSTAATLLAQQGRTVRLYERAQHPRFHIGESLLPNNLPILERLGVLEAVRKIGVHKPAAEFICQSGQRQVFPFARALGRTPDHAFQVRRAEFDELLLRNSARHGVDVREQHDVESVRLAPDPSTCHEIGVRNADGEVESVRARYVLDATGRDAVLAKANRWHQRDQRHASAAIFSHFSGVTRRDGADEGNISVYWFDGGWAWMIPLRDGSMSVGAVCGPDHLKRRRADNELFLRETIDSIPDAGRRMSEARCIAPVHVTGNYSYRSQVMSGPGFALIGDAFAFVDPVFSSGVYLAMNSAERSTALVGPWLNEDTRAYRREQRRFERRVRGKLKSFSWFIYRFTTPAMRDLFENPRNDWQVEQAVVSMLAGDGDEQPRIRRRLAIFKAIYACYAAARSGEQWSAWRARRRGRRSRLEEDTIMRPARASIEGGNFQQPVSSERFEIKQSSIAEM